MNFETLRLLRDLCLKMAIVATVISLGSAVILFGMWDVWSKLCFSLYKLDSAQLMLLCVYFYSAAKFFVIYMLLTPALALHWTMRSAHS